MAAGINVVRTLSQNASTATLTATATGGAASGVTSSILAMSFGAGTFNVGSPSDSVNGGYARDLGVSGSTAGRATLASLVNTTGAIVNGSTTESAATPAATSKLLYGFTMTGGNAGALDKNPASKSGLGTAVTTTTTGTLTQATELAFLLVMWDTGATISVDPTGGWTNIFGPLGSVGTLTNVINSAVYYLETAATTALAPSLTLSSSVQWSAQVTTYTWTDSAGATTLPNAPLVVDTAVARASSW
jgi:hypothetical protein